MSNRLSFSFRVFFLAVGAASTVACAASNDEGSGTTESMVSAAGTFDCATAGKAANNVAIEAESQSGEVKDMLADTVSKLQDKFVAQCMATEPDTIACDKIKDATQQAALIFQSNSRLANDKAFADKIQARIHDLQGRILDCLEAGKLGPG